MHILNWTNIALYDLMVTITTITAYPIHPPRGKY